MQSLSIKWRTFLKIRPSFIVGCEIYTLLAILTLPIDDMLSYEPLDLMFAILPPISVSFEFIRSTYKLDLGDLAPLMRYWK